MNAAIGRTVGGTLIAVATAALIGAGALGGGTLALGAGATLLLLPVFDAPAATADNRRRPSAGFVLSGAF